MNPLDDNSGPASSAAPDTTLDDAVTTEEATDASVDGTGAASSTAQGDTHPDMLSLVRDVVDQRPKTEGSASPAEGQESGQEAGAQATTQPDDEDYSDVPFHKHPRFQHLLRKAKTNEADATRYRNVQSFLDEHAVTPEEASEALIVAGLMKTNPIEAWKRLRPVVQSLLPMIGEVLPDDLQSRVQTGELSREAAMELSRARATATVVQQQQTFEQQQRERRQKTETANALVGAADAWEADRRAKDPNFDAKLGLIQKEIAWIQTKEGRPATPEGVRQQLERAYKAVVLPTAAPAAPAPVRRAPAPSGQAVTNAAPKPQSTMDIIRHQLSRRAG